MPENKPNNQPKVTSTRDKKVQKTLNFWQQPIWKTRLPINDLLFYNTANSCHFLDKIPKLFLQRLDTLICKELLKFLKP
jgi:hypothetical protein